MLPVHDADHHVVRFPPTQAVVLNSKEKVSHAVVSLCLLAECTVGTICFAMYICGLFCIYCIQQYFFTKILGILQQNAINNYNIFKSNTLVAISMFSVITETFLLIQYIFVFIFFHYSLQQIGISQPERMSGMMSMQS